MASQFWKFSDGKSPINLLSERSTICNLGNLKLECQLPIAPWNMLDLKIRTCSCGRAPSQKGKLWSIWLFPRTKCSSIMHLANDLAIWPWNWFSPKSITLKFFGTVRVEEWGHQDYCFPNPVRTERSLGNQQGWQSSLSSMCLIIILQGLY